MNDEQLKAEGVKWLASLRETAEKAQGFVLDQAPGTIRELVLLGRIQSTVIVVMFLTLLISSAWGLWYLLFGKLSKIEDGSDRSLVRGFGGLIVTLVGIFSFMGILSEIHSFASAWFAPRIYILETLATLAGKVAGK